MYLNYQFYIKIFFIFCKIFKDFLIIKDSILEKVSEKKRYYLDLELWVPPCHVHTHKNDSICPQITIDMSALCSMLPVILPPPPFPATPLLRVIHCIVCIDTERLSNWQKLTCHWQALFARSPSTCGHKKWGGK